MLESTVSIFKETEALGHYNSEVKCSEDGSVARGLAMQAWESKFDPQNPLTKLSL